MTTLTRAPGVRPARVGERAPEAPAQRRHLMSLAAFAALAAFGAAHWARLVTDPPAGRVALAVLIAVAGGAALTVTRRLLSAPIALATLLGALVVTGLPARLLLPGNWDALTDGVDRGLSGLRGVDWPYSGPDEWVRLVILLGAPLLLGIAAALAFWPARTAPVLRAAALVALLLLYGTAVTERDPGQPLLRGLALLALVAAWLWLPRLKAASELARATAVIATAGLCALPLAGGLDAERPWWDYRSWEWFGGGKVVTFDWTHSYGPLDWPREGTTLLEVKSARPHYWKAETLDSFDGFRWLRSRQSGRAPPGGESQDNPRWHERFRVTVRSLRSELIVGAGSTYEVRGVGGTAGSADGTHFALGDPLEKGDSYTVHAYVPNPSADQLRRAPSRYEQNLTPYTAIFLPRRGRVVVPLRGDRLTGSERAVERLLASPYGPMYRLARRLTAGAPTAYEAVKRIEDHLQGQYEYGERPPSRRYPLAAFLSEDRIGYCQQFSGAMALMLRMLGIPSRVAAGFAPGSYNRDTGEYRVRDLDAHSWVEVHFGGIGWVPFDPTPAIAPAASQESGLGDTTAAGGDLSDVRTEDSRSTGSERSSDGAAAAGGPATDGIAWPVLAPILVLLAAGAALALLAASGRLGRRGLAGPEAQLHELRSALLRLGFSMPPRTTLLELERRLAPAVGPAAARYAAALRAHRYQRGPATAPGPSERRALRRELGARRGWRGRLRALMALPPRRRHL